MLRWTVEKGIGAAMGEAVGMAARLSGTRLHRK
jgi:hypothetical protein